MNAARSWVASANAPGADFPLANLPYGAFAAAGAVHLGVAIGDQVFDLFAAAESGWLAESDPEPLPEALLHACRASVLNPLMALGPDLAARLRSRLQAGLREGYAARERLAACLRPLAGCEMRLPAQIGDYTDFYASVEHATNVGRLFRPSNPLLPNYKYVPIGYHGRASSVEVSPALVRRPCGQRPPAAEAGAPDFGPCRQLDYELEVGAFIGAGNPLGEPIPLARAERHIFGLCLLNDWSARDIQRWEYQPLGPFLGKSFATTISPWVVPLEALRPFRVPAAARPEGDPAPLPYLYDPQDQALGGLDVTLEVWLASAEMRDRHLEPVRLSRGNLRRLYWTLAQMTAHHTSNGCNLRPGDLLGTGTVSGPGRDQRGCLLELAAGERGAGTEPVMLPTGETRKFLADGDEVIFRAWCGNSAGRIGFGECRGCVLPAVSP